MNHTSNERPTPPSSQRARSVWPLLLAVPLVLVVAALRGPSASAARPAAPHDFAAFPISTALANQLAPAVGDQVVVWNDERNLALNSTDLYAWDRATQQEFGLVVAPLPQLNPAASGDWVVYQQGTNVEGNYTLNGIRISSRQVITIAQGPANPINPAIAGNIVVWQDTRNYNTEGYDIYGYDLAASQEFTVSTALDNQFSPRISGNIVVWQDLRNRNTTGGDIYGRNLTTGQEFPICTAPGNQLVPDVAGNIVVWQDYRNDGAAPDIYGYNLTTQQEFPIAVVPGSSQTHPRVAGNWVVWQDDRNGVNNIAVYGYYLPTGQTYPIWTATNTRSPAIFGNLVAWEDYRNGNDSDLYGATLPDPPPPLTGTPTPLLSSTPTPPLTGTPPPLLSSTPTPPPAPTRTAGPASATPTRPTGSPTALPATPRPPSATPSPPAATVTPCAITFSDVHPADYFYTPVIYLACHGVISGYGDGTFRPYAQTTRGQQVKIVVLGFQKPISTPAAGGYTFADVAPTFPFFAVIETAAADGIVSGYHCGGPGEPCDAQSRPYFRPYANVTRGQLSKIVVGAAGWTLSNPPAPGSFADVAPGSAFYPFVETAACHGIVSGYACGGPGEPCDPQTRPYFRPYNPATRGQIAKIVYLAIGGGARCTPAGARP